MKWGPRPPSPHLHLQSWKHKVLNPLPSNMTNIKRYFLVKAELVASLRLLYWGPPDPPPGPPTMLLDPICLTIDQPPKFRQPVWWAQLCLFFLSKQEKIFSENVTFSHSPTKIGCRLGYTEIEGSPSPGYQLGPIVRLVKWTSPPPLAHLCRTNM